MHYLTKPKTMIYRQVYRRLKGLLPTLNQLAAEERWVSQYPLMPPLYARVHGQYADSTSLMLTQYKVQDKRLVRDTTGQFIPEVLMQIMAFHDFKMAKVVLLQTGAVRQAVDPDVSDITASYLLNQKANTQLKRWHKQTLN